MADEPSEAAAARRRVLVIDDEPALRMTLEMVLRRQYDVTTCGTGQEALAHLDAGERCDVILCDLAMQGMSGVDLYRALASSRPELGARVVFLTGGVFSPSVQAFLDSVPNTVLEKPFDFDALRATIARIAAG